VIFLFCPIYIFVIREPRHFKFRVLIDTQEYECTHDILLLKGMCSESRDVFKFWEINDNIFEKAQDRDISVKYDTVAENWAKN